MGLADGGEGRDGWKDGRFIVRGPDGAGPSREGNASVARSATATLEDGTAASGGYLGSKGAAGEEAGAVAVESDDEFAEDGVGPGEPAAGEFLGIVFPESFVHETGAAVAFLELAEAVGDFPGVGAGQGLHDEGHGPDVTLADVRAAAALSGFALEEIGVALAEDEFAGAFIEGIVG